MGEGWGVPMEGALNRRMHCHGRKCLLRLPGVVGSRVLGGNRVRRGRWVLVLLVVVGRVRLWIVLV